MTTNPAPIKKKDDTVATGAESNKMFHYVWNLRLLLMLSHGNFIILNPNIVLCLFMFF